ncbi:Uncharacterised protein [Bordetella pertussis]|nr:Uncharacterised protein [Bordetella pertussis]
MFRICVQRPIENRIVPPMMVSYAYQYEPPAPECPARVPRRRRPAEPARGGAAAAFDAQRRQPADPHAGNPAGLRAVRSPCAPPGAQSRRAGAAARHRARPGAAGRRRPGRRRSSGRLRTAPAHFGPAFAGTAVAAATHGALACAPPGHRPGDRNLAAGRGPAPRGLSRRPALRARALGRPAVRAAVRYAHAHDPGGGSGHSAAPGGRGPAAAGPRAAAGRTGVVAGVVPGGRTEPGAGAGARTAGRRCADRGPPGPACRRR